MTNNQEEKKLNRLTINKETIADLEVQNQEDVKGGACSATKATDTKDECKTVGCPVIIPRTNNTCGIKL